MMNDGCGGVSDGVSRKANSGEWSECLYCISNLYHSTTVKTPKQVSRKAEDNDNVVSGGGMELIVISFYAERSRGQLKIILIVMECLLRG